MDWENDFILAEKVIETIRPFNRLLKKARLLRSPHSSSLRRTSMYASFRGISGALYLNLFEQPVKKSFPHPVN